MRDFNDILLALQHDRCRRRIAVVWGADPTTRQAVTMAIEQGIAEAVFVGCRDQVESDPDVMRHSEMVSIVDAADPDQAAATAVRLVHEGRADIVMKGLINSDNLLRAILNKEQGLLPKGQVLTHISVTQLPPLAGGREYGKLLALTDVAVIPYPTAEQRLAQVRYAVDFMHRMGEECPKVALTHCSEKVDERHFPFTADYARIATMAQEGEFGACIVDGPMDVKTALDAASLRKKGMTSPINGEADVIVFPDIEAGNTFYKTVSLFGAVMAGMLCGSMAPVVLGSRGDSARSKFCSILIAGISCPKQ